MKTDTSDADALGSEPALPAGTIFDLLLDGRRRYALYYLSRKVGAVSLEELAEAIACWEGTPTAERVARVSTGLHHTHLPRLLDAGVVRYDPAAETVERLAAADGLEPHLELAIADDLRRR